MSNQGKICLVCGPGSDPAVAGHLAQVLGQLLGGDFYPVATTLVSAAGMVYHISSTVGAQGGVRGVVVVPGNFSPMGIAYFEEGLDAYGYPSVAVVPTADTANNLKKAGVAARTASEIFAAPPGQLLAAMGFV